jgi:uncharacterized protein (UPF0332 family)
VPPLPPNDLFEQAELLVARAGQVDLRRAISAAYYGMFHFILTAAADMVVGAGQRSSARYALVYRSVDHGRLRTLCGQLSTSRPQVPFAPTDGFGQIADFARVTANHIELRNSADYDPSRNFAAEEAELAISEARQAIDWFQQGSVEQQEAFLTLLLFKSR